MPNVFTTNINSNDGRSANNQFVTNLDSVHDDSFTDPRDMTGRGLMKSSRLDYEEQITMEDQAAAAIHEVH